MGFSVSGATVIIFLAMFISFGMFYSSAYNGFERVNDARTAQSEHVLSQENTALNITTVNYSDGYLNVTVNNTGSTTLDVTDTDVLVDGVYPSKKSITARDVDGVNDTELWLPGESLHYQNQRLDGPDTGESRDRPGTGGYGGGLSGERLHLPPHPVHRESHHRGERRRDVLHGYPAVIRCPG